MASKKNLTHLDDQGRAQMVNISDKDVSERIAVAEVLLQMQPETLSRIVSLDTPKGDVLAAARIAGIQAAKQTPNMIPLCHQIALTSCSVDFAPDVAAGELRVKTTVKCMDRTGVEMEALCAASVAALTVYDMVKAIDRGMQITALRLVEKRGGRSGHWQRG